MKNRMKVFAVCCFQAASRVHSYEDCRTGCHATSEAMAQDAAQSRDVLCGISENIDLGWRTRRRKQSKA